jgi:hypothetical protein
MKHINSKSRSHSHITKNHNKSYQKKKRKKNHNKKGLRIPLANKPGELSSKVKKSNHTFNQN